METFARQLRERARQLGISNAEAARRSGLEEGRYGHYIAGRREPDLATLNRIALALNITPNWLLGFRPDAHASTLLRDRLNAAAMVMSEDDLETAVVQAEAVIALRRR